MLMWCRFSMKCFASCISISKYRFHKSKYNQNHMETVCGKVAPPSDICGTCYKCLDIVKWTCVENSLLLCATNAYSKLTSLLYNLVYPTVQGLPRTFQIL